MHYVVHVQTLNFEKRGNKKDLPILLSGEVFTFQDLKVKIYSYIKKKAIWHLSIRQNWCFGQFHPSKIKK